MDIRHKYKVVYFINQKKIDYNFILSYQFYIRRQKKIRAPRQSALKV